jgi:hypothetical protein
MSFHRVACEYKGECPSEGEIPLLYKEVSYPRH